jgi:type I restriction enzyme S subunit
MLKPGYKQTDLGMLPEEWEVKPILKISPLQRGFDLPNSLRVDGDYPVVYSNGIVNTHHKAMVRGPGVVTGRSGTIGNVTYVPGDYWPHNTALWVTNFLGNDPKFIYYLLVHINLNQFSTGSGVPTLNRNDVHSFEVRIPPPAEQKAIAEALSAIDALLTSQQEFLAKKRALKLATQQALLSGERRLPGFVGEWEVRPLSAEIEGLDSGVSVNSVAEEGEPRSYNSYILKTSAVLNGAFKHHEAKRIIDKDINRARLNPKRGSIIISRMNTIDLVGESGYVDKDYGNLFVPDRLWQTRLFNYSQVDTKWLSYILSSEPYKRQLKDIATGTSGSMKNIAKDAFLAIEASFPPPAEQHAIAAILSDMDAEIEALAAQVAKTQALKQGMMQDLLTGTIRLWAGAAPSSPPTL